MNSLKSLRFGGLLKNFAACAAVLLGSVAATEARQVDVYLTSKRFGHGQTIHATSDSRKMTAATSYTYELKGKVRGQTGKPIEKLVKKDTDIATLVETISPGGSSFLKGTISNPGGTLPVNVINKKFSGIRKVKGVGDVSISFTVVGKIEADGTCVLNVNKVKVKAVGSDVNLGSIIFQKGSMLSLKSVP